MNLSTSQNLSILVITNRKDFMESVDRLTNATPSLKNFSKDSLTLETFQKTKQAPSVGPSVILIDLASAADFSPVTAKEISLRFPNSLIVCAGYPSDPSLVTKFMKMGVNDFIAYPFDSEEARAALSFDNNKSHASLEVAEEKSKKNSIVVSVYSPKGGTGVTLMTTNLAVALAQGDLKNQVALCDLSNQCGDVCTYLNLNPKYTLRDIIDNNPLLDASFLEGVMLRHASGIKILAAPRHDQDPPGPDHLNAFKSILTLLKSTCKVILIDASHLHPALLQYVLSESDLIYLMGNPDLVSLKGLITFFKKLKSLHFDSNKIKVIINRANSKSQIDAKEFEKITHHPIAYSLPNNYVLCVDAVNAGEPLNNIQEKTDLAKKLDELADSILKLIGSSGDTGSSKSDANQKSYFGFSKKEALR